MKISKNLIIIVLLVIVTGCATISHGPIEEVTFSSETDSVDVAINEKYIGQMPVSTDLWKIKACIPPKFLRGMAFFHYYTKTT